MNDKRTQKNIRRRRGAGIEMAMILMLVVVAFSALLTSTTIMQLNKQNSSTAELELLQQRAILDQIGRDFCEQREHYALPAGVNGNIIYDCSGCCIGCDECDKKYEPPKAEESPVENGDTESNDSTATIEDAGNSDGGGNTEGDTPSDGSEPVDDRTETACCNTCGCSTGCTGFTKISLVASYGEETLIVELKKNQEGSFAVIQWSYVG